MARIWKGRRSGPPQWFFGETLAKVSPLGGGFIESPYPAPPPVPSRDPKLDPGPAYFISVYGFTFEFWSVAQIEAALKFYRAKFILALGCRHGASMTSRNGGTSERLNISRRTGRGSESSGHWSGH